MIKNIILSVLTIGILTGCTSTGIYLSYATFASIMIANKDKEEIKITLLPEKDGKVGVISLKDDKGVEHTIDEAYKSLEVSDDGSIKDTIASQKEIESKYDELLKAIPDKPKNYYFFFDSGSASLKDSQIKEIKKVADFIIANNIQRVLSIGHSDSTGSDEINEKVSRQRAKAIEEVLLLEGVDPKLIEIKYYGDANPLVKTKENESNAKNRRVEIVLK